MVDAIHGAIVHHQRSTTHTITTHFFGRLKQKAHIAFEGATSKFCLEQMRHPQQNGGVGVVATSVHSTGCLRGKAESRRFENRQGVHVGANPNGGAIAGT